MPPLRRQPAASKTLQLQLHSWDWNLLNYVLDRTHIRRLQLELETTVNQKEGRYHLVVTITVKNPGRSNVEITQKGSGLVISKLRTSDVVANVVESQWDAEIALDIFTANMSIQRDMSIEPGLTVIEERLILLPAQQDVFLLTLRVFRKRNWIGILPTRTWNTTKIVAVG